MYININNNNNNNEYRDNLYKSFIFILNKYNVITYFLLLLKNKNASFIIITVILIDNVD